MAHIKREIIHDYIQADISDNSQKEIEQHLDSCDTCFEQYLNLIEQQTMEYALSDNFTDVVVERINQQNPGEIFEKSQSSFYQSNKAIINYFLAAGLTIVLMLTGVFQQIVTITDISDRENRPSVTEHLMERTNGILDQMKGDLNNE